MSKIEFLLIVFLPMTLLLVSCTGKEEEAPVVKVQSVAIDQSDMTLTEGESVNLSAKALPENAEDKTISWSTSDERVVMVSSNGKAMALSIGKAVVTAKCGDKSDFITITVEAKVVPVTGVSLDKTQIAIKVGESETLTPTITPEDATNKKVSWTSSNDEVATVEDGKIVGVKPGSVTITVTTEDGAKTAECSVTVKSNLAPSVTVGSERISAVSAVLMGKANLESTTASDLKVGFQYSKSAGILPSNSITVEATGADANYNYTASIIGLDPNTKYYFRSFVRQNGQDTYGETKEFTTKGLSSMLHTHAATSISSVSACLNASLDLTDVKYKTKSFGFYWGSSDDLINSKVTAQEGNGMISSDLLNLTPSREYFFRAYIVLDDKEYKDDVVSFTTKDIDSILVTLDASNVEAAKAILNAKLDLSDVKYSSKTYGFYLGTTANAQNSRMIGGEIRDSKYSASLSNLSHKTQYWYKAYVTLDSQTLYGETKTFTTDVVPVESVSLSNSEFTFNTIGNTLQLYATVLPTNATDKGVTWTSDNEGVATVDILGRVKAKGNGTATITATSNNPEKTASCFITVAQSVTGITLRTSVMLNEGQEMTLTPTVNPATAADKSLTWTSSNTSVATVDDDGKVTAVFKGTATIKAEAKDGSGKYATCALTVKRPVASIELNKSSLLLYRGTSNITEILTASVSPSDADNTTVTWASSNTSVATVSSSGVITGRARGTAIITVTANDGNGAQASCEVEVKQYVTSIILDRTSITLNEGQEQELLATVSPSYASDTSLIWTSADEQVATVDRDGKVTAISKGTTTIRAEAKDGSREYATCTVSVTIGTTGVALNTHNLNIYIGEKYEFKATVSPSNADNKNVLWTSKDPSIASVSSEGIVRGIDSGSTTVIVRTQDGNYEDNCDISVWRHASRVSIDKTSVEVYPGEIVALAANVYPEDAHNKNVNWYSDNTSIAEISNDGIVKGISAGYTTVYARTEDGGHTASCAVNVKQHATGIALNHSSVTIYSDESLTLIATVIPNSTANKSVIWSSSDISIAEVNNGVVTPHIKGNVTITAKTADGSDLTANCEIKVKTAVPKGAVDLGLSVYWATCDLGAGSNTVPGTLYAWGETSTKNSFSLENYKYYNGTSYTKYNNEDGKTILDADDDAAKSILGGRWRMPTIEEYNELCDNCDIAQDGSVFIFTSKVEGFSDRSVTIPVRGFNPIGNKCHWTSSKNDNKVEYGLLMNLGIAVLRSVYGSRYDGYPIRPVYEQ